MKFLFSTPFPGVTLALLPFLWVLGLVASFWQWCVCERDLLTNHQHLQLFAGRNMMLVLMASSSSKIHLGLFLCLLVHFTLSFLFTFTFSSLVCSSRLHLNLLYLVSFMYVRHYFFYYCSFSYSQKQICPAIGLHFL